MGEAFEEYLNDLVSKPYITPLTDNDISEHWFWLLSTGSEYGVDVVETMKMRKRFVDTFKPIPVP